MKQSANTWAFVATFDKARCKRLEAFETFEKVLDIVCLSCKTEEAWVREGEELGQPDCWRPVVALNVGTEAFDAFFNSPGGYRAQYLLDPDSGQAANSRLLRALEPRLTDAVVEQCGEAKLNRLWVRNALRANSAKIWPDEESLNWDEQAIDLAIDRWRQPCDWIHAPKYAGLWAPEGERLKVFGAFIDPYGNEIVSRKKIGRRFEIHECGFS